MLTQTSSISDPDRTVVVHRHCSECRLLFGCQKPSTTTEVLNGVFGRVNWGDSLACQKRPFLERTAAVAANGRRVPLVPNAAGCNDLRLRYPMRDCIIQYYIRRYAVSADDIDDYWTQSVPHMSAVAPQRLWEFVPVTGVKTVNEGLSWAPAELIDILFSSNEAEAAQEKTYLLVDATLRTNVTGMFDLDVVDLPITCLFNGEAADEQAEVAPYLIDVTVLANESTRFHRDFFGTHWGQGTGIFLKSTATLGELKKHLRKFTKLRMQEDGRWVFFRFWDPAIAAVYFETIDSDAIRSGQWFGRDLVRSIVVEVDGGDGVRVFKPVADNVLASNQTLPAVVLTPEELRPFRETAFDKQVKAMVIALKRDFDLELKAYSVAALVRIVRPCLERFMKYGFKRRENLHIIAAWAAFYGPEFETKDPQGELQRICDMKVAEVTRMKALKNRMAQFGNPERAA